MDGLPAEGPNPPLESSILPTHEESPDPASSTVEHPHDGHTDMPPADIAHPKVSDQSRKPSLSDASQEAYVTPWSPFGLPSIGMRAIAMMSWYHAPIYLLLCETVQISTQRLRRANL